MKTLTPKQKIVLQAIKKFFSEKWENANNKRTKRREC